jgi:chemotaxis protein histidine kinase CheA
MAGNERNEAAPALADVVDTAHLARYTMGDEALERELLRMFATQLQELVGGLRAARKAGDAAQWRLLAHTLKGAARAVGAFPIAEIAARAEKDGPGAAGAVRLKELEAQVAQFHAAFRRWEEALIRHESECA